MKDNKKKKPLNGKGKPTPEKPAKKPASKTDKPAGKPGAAASAKKPGKKPIAPKKPVALEKSKKADTKPKKQATKTLKPSAVQKPAATSKQPKKTDKPKNKLTPIKHSDEYENRTDGENKIFIVGKKQKQKRPSRRELKRVAKAGGFTVFDGARSGKTFATEEEALNYAVDVLMRTGEVVPVSRTDRQITHTFKPEEQKKK